jgi:hypothetical protein
LLVSIITILIYDNRSLLFVNAVSIKTISLSLFLFSGININLLLGLLICYCNCLFSCLMLLVVGLVVWVAMLRLKDDFGWYIDVIYIPLVR